MAPIRKAMIVLLVVFLFIFVTVLEGTSVAVTVAPTIVRIDNPSPQAAARFGMAVAGIGDIDGDGIRDLAVGAPWVDLVYLFSGDDQSIIDIIVDPEGLSDLWFGHRVRGISDINDDGVEDLVIGAPGIPGGVLVPCSPFDPECDVVPGQGRAFIFSGETRELILKLEPETGDYIEFGYSFAPLGDVNGDEVTDIAVGAPFLFRNRGRVFALSGADSSQLWKIIEPEPGPPDDYVQEIASIGQHMAEIDDLDDDNYTDLLVAAPFHDNDPDPDETLITGRAYLLSGVDGGTIRIHDDPDQEDADFFGGGVGSIGDQNGDGKEDYAIGAYGIGVLYLYSGDSGDLMNKIQSPTGGGTDYFGYQIAKVEDKDGDGLDDFWVSAPMTGTVYLMNSTGDVILQVDDPNPFDYGGSEGGFGWNIFATEDLDGDGQQDLIVGKPLEPVDDFNRAGATFLLLGVHENHPPVADAGPDQTVHVASDCMATVTLDGSGSYDPDGDPLTYTWTWDGGTATGVNPEIHLPPSIYTITLVVYDGTEDSEDTVIINVGDTTPPEISLSVDQDTLWPPNHKMIDVGFSFELSDNCDSEPAASVEVTSDEPTATAPDAGGPKHAPDAEIADDTVFLRAERSGIGNGRVYMITVEATDASGNGASSSMSVKVNCKKKEAAIDSGQMYNSLEIN